MKLKYAELKIDQSVVAVLGAVVGKNLTKGKTAYYYERQRKWRLQPIVVVAGGIKVPKDTKTWRLFLSRCIRQSMKIAFEDGSWGCTVNTYNRKLRALLEFEANGTFVVPRCAGKKMQVIDRTKLNREQTECNKLRLGYIVPMIQSEIGRQLAMLDDLFPDVDACKIRRDLVVRFSFAPKIVRSKGGKKNCKPYLKFALSQMDVFEKSGTKTWHEYDSFAADPEIGSVVNCSLGEYIVLLVAHELAHVVQFELRTMFRNGALTDWDGCLESDLIKAHGVGWKQIYRKLRGAAIV
ncbi:hypothetical protein [Photobacterium damselae]|uniref:hypothetical protein n=1 Tax=Photobacterium damselae TaxID=38293 RepID=UPI001F37724A|nr:hypothetical protein [Photobacterium damselae]UKA05007.1 hypothetical protein IHC89_22435 [Photobacterium damselae subsp. damselae]